LYGLGRFGDAPACRRGFGQSALSLDAEPIEVGAQHLEIGAELARHVEGVEMEILHVARRQLREMFRQGHPPHRHGIARRPMLQMAAQQVERSRDQRLAAESARAALHELDIGKHALGGRRLEQAVVVFAGNHVVAGVVK